MASPGFRKVACGKNLKVGGWAAGCVMQGWVNRVEGQGRHKNSELAGADTESCLWHSDENHKCQSCNHIHNLFSPKAT